MLPPTVLSARRLNYSLSPEHGGEVEPARGFLAQLTLAGRPLSEWEQLPVSAPI